VCRDDIPGLPSVIGGGVYVLQHQARTQRERRRQARAAMG